MKENLRKFREETQKLEETEGLQKARQKFVRIQGCSVKHVLILAKSNFVAND